MPQYSPMPTYENTEILRYCQPSGDNAGRGVNCVCVSVLVLVHSEPWLCCARVANDLHHSGATVLGLPKWARPSAKGLARQSLVE